MYSVTLCCMHFCCNCVQDEMNKEHERKLMTLKVNKPLFAIFMFSVRGLSHEIAVIIRLCNILCSPLLYMCTGRNAGKT